MGLSMPQTEKTDKANHVAVDGERKPVYAETAIDEIQTEKMLDACAESDPTAGVNGKRRLPDDYVTLVLTMPREDPIDTEDLSFITDLAKLMNRSDDWIEERKRRYLERAALSKRINERFVQFQDSMREEWMAKGCVETEIDFDDRDAMVEEFNREMWSQHNDFTGLI